MCNAVLIDYSFSICLCFVMSWFGAIAVIVLFKDTHMPRTLEKVTNMQLARISTRVSLTCWTGMSSTTEITGMQLHHNLQKTEAKLPGNWTGHSSQSFIAQWSFSFVYFCVSLWIVCIVEVAQEVDEGTCFTFIQLIEQGSGLYDESHWDYA